MTQSRLDASDEESESLSEVEDENEGSDENQGELPEPSPKSVKRHKTQTIKSEQPLLVN